MGAEVSLLMGYMRYWSWNMSTWDMVTLWSMFWCTCPHHMCVRMSAWWWRHFQRTPQSMTHSWIIGRRQYWRQSQSGRKYWVERLSVQGQFGASCTGIWPAVDSSGLFSICSFVIFPVHSILLSWRQGWGEFLCSLIYHVLVPVNVLFKPLSHASSKCNFSCHCLTYLSGAEDHFRKPATH